MDSRLQPVVSTLTRCPTCYTSHIPYPTLALSQGLSNPPVYLSCSYVLCFPSLMSTFLLLCPLLSFSYVYHSSLMSSAFPSLQFFSLWALPSLLLMPFPLHLSSLTSLFLFYISFFRKWFFNLAFLIPLLPFFMPPYWTFTPFFSYSSNSRNAGVNHTILIFRCVIASL